MLGSFPYYLHLPSVPHKSQLSAWDFVACPLRENSREFYDAELVDLSLQNLLMSDAYHQESISYFSNCSIYCSLSSTFLFTEIYDLLFYLH